MRPVAGLMCSRDPFHESGGDVVPHAGVTYEDENGVHLSKKHVAQEPADQAKVRKNSRRLS